LVPHTHWDREWYSSFQVFRTRLVRMIDDLLTILAEDPNFSCFTMDGQVAPIEDYLEVRSEREQELRKRIKEGRIIIGPAYIQPDNFLVSGEAHIRNLLLGMRLAEHYGKVMKVGYMPDAFGQIAQMPQILKGCGIDTAVFTRGVGNEGETLRSEFNWRAPDGASCVLAHWLVLHYANLKNVSTNMSSALGYIARTVGLLEKKAATHAVLLMNGDDHVEAQPHIPRVVAEFNRDNPDAYVRIGTFTDYFALIRAEKPALQVYEGEFRGSKYEAVLTGVTSTRMYLKQKNVETEILLEQWVEPFDAWASSLGEKNNSGLIWQAWKYLIQCHPHDSICGCGIDALYDEMMMRFASAQQLGGTVLKNDLCYISSRIGLDSRDYAVVVFNPLNWSRTEAVESTILGKRAGSRFEVTDSERRPVPYGVLGERLIGRAYSAAHKEKVFDIVFLAEDVPPCGYKTYMIRSLGSDGVDRTSDPENSSVSESNGNTIENEYFKVKAEDNGSITLTDKTTGTLYEGFNVLEDGGDVGDEYDYDPPREEKLYSSINSKAKVTLIEAKKTRSTLRIEYRLAIPACATEDRRTRSLQLISCDVTCQVSVSPKVPRIDVKLMFANHAEDHRLRVLFPTGLRSDHAYADQAFHVIRREIAMPQGKNWLEAPAPTHAMQSFVTVDDGEKGVTVATRGLTEYEVRQDGTIAITLLRCVGMLSQERVSTRPGAGPLIPTPGAQCQGQQVFHYSIIPHKGTWETSKSYLQANQYKVGVKTVQVVDHEFAVMKEQAIIPGEFDEPIVKTADSSSLCLPPKLSFLTVEPTNILVTAIKNSEDGGGIIVRLYNTTSGKVEGKVNMYANTKDAAQVNIREEPLEEGNKGKVGAYADKKSLIFEASPFNIKTFKFKGAIIRSPRPTSNKTEKQ
jgi:mannosylglycerate hydrolase